MRMANYLLYSPLHLIQSELGQKMEAKPRRQTSRERSQGLAAMLGREVACLLSQAGLPMGRCCGRVSLSRTKSVSSTLVRRIQLAACSVSSEPQTTSVSPAITSSIRNTRFTDEVPRRPGSPRATPSYKSHTKGLDHASVLGRGSPPPQLKGWQQRRSSGWPVRATEAAGSERQNLNVSVRLPGFMGIVSSAAQATKWPEGTSSLQPAVRLRNVPQHPQATGPTIPQD